MQKPNTDKNRPQRTPQTQRTHREQNATSTTQKPATHKNRNERTERNTRKNTTQKNWFLVIPQGCKGKMHEKRHKGVFALAPPWFFITKNFWGCFPCLRFSLVRSVSSVLLVFLAFLFSVLLWLSLVLSLVPPWSGAWRSLFALCFSCGGSLPACSVLFGSSAFLVLLVASLVSRSSCRRVVGVAFTRGVVFLFPLCPWFVPVVGLLGFVLRLFLAFLVLCSPSGSSLPLTRTA